MVSEKWGSHSKQTKTNGNAVFVGLSLQAVSDSGIGNGDYTVVIAKHGQSVSDRQGNVKVAEKLFDLSVYAPMQYLVSAHA